MEENKIVLTDESGKEYELEILFTYEHEERKTTYFFLYDPKKEDEVMVLKQVGEGELEPVEDDEEYAEVEEVFNAYMEDEKIQEIK